MLSADQLKGHAVIILAMLFGGGSLLLFAGFLIAGPFSLIYWNLSEPQALLWDALLSTMFFLQHSGMVRRSLRAWLSSTIPAHCYPAVYSIASGAVLTAVILLWQPSHTVLFEAQGFWRVPFHAAFLLAVAGFVWAVRSLGTFDPFGRIPVLSHLAGLNDTQQAPRLAVRGPYLWIRHPLYFLMLVFIWAAPSLSLDRLLFDLLWTFWIVLGSYLEEKDLVAQFGEPYRQYQSTVPMLLPWRGPVGRSLERS
jgi:methanethiol S-methyltransferase